MEAFTALLALYWGFFSEFPSHRPVTRSFGVFFDLHLGKLLSKQSRRRWFETPSRSLWRQFNGDGGTFAPLGVYQLLRGRNTGTEVPLLQIMEMVYIYIYMVYMYNGNSYFAMTVSSE